MVPRLPLVRLPPCATVHKLGAASLTPSTALLRFGDKGWTIPHGSESKGSSRAGWAIVGDSEGRRLAVEVRFFPGFFADKLLMHKADIA